jgi:hypothetical protein
MAAKYPFECGILHKDVCWTIGSMKEFVRRDQSLQSLVYLLQDHNKGDEIAVRELPQPNWRPFLSKALHIVHKLQDEDARGARPLHVALKGIPTSWLVAVFHVYMEFSRLFEATHAGKFADGDGSIAMSANAASFSASTVLMKYGPAAATDLMYLDSLSDVEARYALDTLKQLPKHSFTTSIARKDRYQLSGWRTKFRS